MLTEKEIIRYLIEMGVKKGDLLMVHSSYRSLRRVEGGPQTIIDALLNVIGPEGTVLFPTFNFTSWSTQHYFDRLETPSEMGVITEVARLMPTARRTEHPFYSFAVIGPMQDAFMDCRAPSAMGEDSVFELFLAKNGLIISIGLDYNDSFTMIHHTEKMVGIDYRRDKEFGGIYMDEDRTPVLRKYSMFVRANRNITTKVNPALEHLFDQGIIHLKMWGNAEIKYARAQEFHQGLSTIVRSNPEYLHRRKR